MKTVILPGLGADSRMYPKEIYGNLLDVVFADWPEYSGEETIQAVAERVIDQHKIQQNTIVGGSSLGGIVAIQIAKTLNLKKVILIGSTKTANKINPILKRLSVVAEITPFKLIQLHLGKINVHRNSALFAMFEEADRYFIRAMARAIFNWDGIEDYKCDICHIHGEKDRIIYPPRSNVEIIKNGGHLISMSHSEQVKEFININININVNVN